MNQKELIKYGLMIVAAYLAYKYVEEHGGFAAMLGQATGAAGGTGAGPDKPAVDTTGPADTPPPPATTAPAARLDLTGLVVAREINNSLAGTVKINGVPVRLAIIQTDGRIFDGSGAEVTSALESQGINVAQLRQAFAAAGQGMAGVYPLPMRGGPVWLM